MQDPFLSPFHQNLYENLVKAIESKIKEENLDPSNDLHTFHELLQGNSSKKNLGLEEVISKYHHFLSGKKNLALEKLLLSSFNKGQFSLKIHRGLPRVYKKDDPLCSKIKSEFSHLKKLKSILIEQHAADLYLPYLKEIKAKILLVTKVYPDGFGDIQAHREMVKILQKTPNVSYDSLLWIPKSHMQKFENCIEGAKIALYDKKCTIQDLSEQQLQEMQIADLMIYLPTPIDCIEELEKQLKRKKSSDQINTLSFGEYGFIESKDFGPLSGNYSLGLHFLEKGIFLPKLSGETFRDLKDRNILLQIMGTSSPTPLDIQTYKQSHSLYFGYLSHPSSGALYISAILENEKGSLKTIDMICPDIAWLIEHIQISKQKKCSLFEGIEILKEIEIHFGGKIHTQTIGRGKKTLRIFCPKALEAKDFEIFMKESNPFVAVRGNQSLSLAIQMNKIYFYDAPSHCRYFLKDLLSLSTIAAPKNTHFHEYLQILSKLPQLTLDEEKSDMVEETYFQERPSWQILAKNLASYLKSEELAKGFMSMRDYIGKHFNAEPKLLALIARKLVHKQRLDIQEYDEKQLELFCEGHKNIEEVISNIKEYLKTPAPKPSKELAVQKIEKTLFEDVSKLQKQNSGRQSSKEKPLRRLKTLNRKTKNQ